MKSACAKMEGLSAIVSIVLTFTAGAGEAKPRFPGTRTEEKIENVHGIEVRDPYRWLEDGASVEVKAWVDKQNAYTKSVLDRFPARVAIHDRLNDLLDIGTVTTPVPVKGRYFYTKRQGKQNQPVLYVREGLDGLDRVIVDPNLLAADGTIALDWWYPSRDGNLLAYGLSTNGSEQSTLYIRNVATGQDLKDRIKRTRYCSLAWQPDSKAFYYTRYPAIGSVPRGEENYHHQVYLHRLGTEPAIDGKVFGEGRPAEDMPEVTLSPDGRWLIVTEFKGWTQSEVYLKDLKKKPEAFVPLVEKVHATYEVIARNDRLYIRTNENAPRYKLLEVDPLAPQRNHWKDLLPEADQVLDQIAVVGANLVAVYMKRASSNLRILDRTGRRIKDVELPTLGTVTSTHGEWNGQEVFYGFQSFTVAPCIYRIDLATEKVAPWQKIEPRDIDFSRYKVEQIVYRSKDSTNVTMFLASKKEVGRTSHNPTLLYGYGGFNISLTPMFSASQFLFLEAGGLLAVPNLRGGGEYGESWHRAGMLDKKQNVFDDYVAAAEWLIEQKYTNRKKLAIYGRSNGGLLVGAALVQRPDLFAAVVCQVPLLDMLRYHHFLIARLWISEYGSAEKSEQFRWLYGYSPYHLVKRGVAYPAVLLEASESDSRVDALHARKMAAQLQAATSSNKPILLRLETKAGHGAGKPRVQRINELTDLWSFLFWQLGIGAKATAK